MRNHSFSSTSIAIHFTITNRLFHVEQLLKSAGEIEDKGELSFISKIEATRGTGSWRLDSTKSARSPVGPKSAGEIEDKGELSFISKIEATRGTGSWRLDSTNRATLNHKER